MKQFFNALIGVIMDILEFLAVVGERIWHALKRMVRWLIPRAKAASIWGKQKLKKEWEELPGQIEWVKNTSREKSNQLRDKAAQFRENLPEHRRKMKEAAQKGVKVVTDASLRTKEAFYQGAEAIHRNVEKFKESIDVPEPEDDEEDEYEDDHDNGFETGKVIVMHPIVNVTTNTEPNSEEESTTLEIRHFQFQKRHLWVIIVVCGIVGGVSTSYKKKHNAAVQQSAAIQPSGSHSPTGQQNNSVNPPSLEQIQAQTEAIKEMNEQMKIDIAERREAEAAAKAVQTEAEAKAKQKVQELINAQAERRAQDAGVGGLQSR